LLEFFLVLFALNFFDPFLLFFNEFTHRLVKNGALGLPEDLNFTVFERAVDMVDPFSQFVLLARKGGQQILQPFLALYQFVHTSSVSKL
jgi:hypothetical protein